MLTVVIEAKLSKLFSLRSQIITMTHNAYENSKKEFQSETYR